MVATKKSILTKTTASIALLGLIVASIPFIESLRPNARAVANLPHIDLSEISPGHYSLKHPEQADLFRGYKWAVFVYRKYDGSVKLWNVPVRKGKVGMPDLHWWQPIYECENFGPTVVNGRVQEDQPITCHDPEIHESWKKVWKWDINGKNVKDSYYDLEPTKGSVEGNYFIVGKRE